MKTLGYCEAQVYKKFDIAKVQLRESIELFAKERFIPSLTLAGAAEEILAGLLKSKGQKSVIEESMEYIHILGDQLNIEEMKGRDKRSTYNEWNHAKNRTKHHDKDESDEITINYCDEAYWMIKRAISNGKSLGWVIENEDVFENWVIQNVCL